MRLIIESTSLMQKCSILMIYSQSVLVKARTTLDSGDFRNLNSIWVCNKHKMKSEELLMILIYIKAPMLFSYLFTCFFAYLLTYLPYPLLKLPQKLNWTAHVKNLTTSQRSEMQCNSYFLTFKIVL